jgi:hypothetical protein
MGIPTIRYGRMYRGSGVAKTQAHCVSRGVSLDNALSARLLE